MTIDEAWREGYQEGYRRALDATLPRTVATAEDLDAVPDGIILRSGGVTYEHHDGWFHGVDGSNVGAESLSLPAVVLHEPEGEVGAWSA